MTSELSKYLNEQLDVFLNVEQQMQLTKNVKNGFLSKNYLYNVIFYQILMLFRLLKISYVPVEPQCAKSVRIRSFSGPYFPAFGLNRRDTLYLSVFSPNAGKYGPEKSRIWTLFTQC